MKNGIIGCELLEYDVPAAMNDEIAPASLIPSSRICPSVASL